MSDDARDELLIEAMDAYDEAVKEQQCLNNLAKAGLVTVLQAKMRLETTESRELHPDDYPDTVEAKLKITSKKGSLSLVQNTRLPDPSTYFSRSPDGLSDVQRAYLDLLKSALRLSEKRQRLKELATEYQKLRE
eukprot:TRINITY_DN10960_c0_g1_i1.p1 TRINITY_DN10960_c0_g1~~TRINITY_DN10960_c0_g1_i1.p1  ORF type:complete len:145 (+),score=43.71 TRINITY_DN10960_c0_g1_i1:35-436(+)